MTNYASAVESAKILKATLRAAFPATKFSVTLSRGTGYGFCSVHWMDGPSVRRVDAICHTFEGEGFDGMTDSTYQKDGRLPDGRATGLRGINTSRRISARFAARLIDAIGDYWGDVTERPTVSANDYDGAYTLSFKTGNRHQSVRPDLNFDWDQAIHRAAGDRTSVVHSARLAIVR